MTPQQKIQELAMAALRSAPVSAGAPKPATFISNPEKLRAMIPAAKAEVAVDVPPEEEKAADAKPEAKPFKDQADPELRSMIDQRESQKNASLKRRSLAVTFSVVALLGSVGVWVAVSPAAQAQVARVVPLFQETVRDAKSLADTKENFDKALGKVAVHGQHLDDATRSIGAEPESFTAEQNAELDSAMEDMMGGEGRTTADRNKELQDKLGFVRKLPGQK